jgi:hypothetical protein
MPSQDLQTLLDRLSPQQKEVLRRVCQNQPYKQIAEDLVVTESTVKSHMQKVYRRLELFDLPPNQRVATILNKFCPLLDNPETPIIIDVEPEPEPDAEPLSPEVDEMLMSDQKAIIAIQTPQSHSNNLPKKTTARKRKRSPLGCMLGVLIVIILLAIGGLVLKQYIPGAPLITRGPVYEMGEWHSKDDLSVSLTNARIEHNGEIRLYLDIWNQGTEDILFSWSPTTHLNLKDNTGHRYAFDILSDMQSQVQTIIKAGDSATVRMSPQQFTVNFTDNAIFADNVHELYFTIEKLSRFDRVTWRIPVGK